MDSPITVSNSPGSSSPSKWRVAKKVALATSAAKEISSSPKPDPLIICPLCTEVIAHAVFLPCLHSVCLACQEQHAIETCPVCRKHIDTSFPTIPNRALTLIAERWKEDLRMRCSNCQLTRPKMYCMECKNSLCPKCSNMVHAIRMFAEHQVIPFRERPWPPCEFTCSIHQVSMDLYCHSHDQLVCIKCQVAAEHAECSIEAAEPAAEQVGSQLSDNKRLEDLFVHIQNHSTDIKRRRQVLIGERERAFAAVQDAFEAATEALRVRKEVLLRNINILCEENGGKLVEEHGNVAIFRESLDKWYEIFGQVENARQRDPRMLLELAHRLKTRAAELILVPSQETFPEDPTLIIRLSDVNILEEKTTQLGYVGRKNPIPVLTHLAPDSGSRQGGTKVRMRGRNLGSYDNLPTIQFGSMVAQEIAVLENGEVLEVTVPPAAGELSVKTVPVTIDWEGQHSSDAVEFTYDDIGWAYILGGHNEETRLDSCVRYDPITGDWTDIPPMRTARAYHGSGKWGTTQIYAFGGQGRKKGRLDSMEMYSTRTGTWEEMAPLLHERYALGSASVAEGILAIGGSDATNACNLVEIYDPHRDTWREGPRLLDPRYGLSCCVQHDQIVYAAGGFYGGSYVSSVEFLDMRMDKWQSIPSLQHARTGLCLAALGDKLVAVGGYDGTRYHRTSEVYDPRIGHWVETMEMTRARYFSTAMTVGEYVYVCGGSEAQSFLQSMESFQASGNIWRAMDELMPQKRYGAASVVA